MKMLKISISKKIAQNVAIFRAISALQKITLSSQK
jgi:hypothetical protein